MKKQRWAGPLRGSYLVYRAKEKQLKYAAQLMREQLRKRVIYVRNIFDIPILKTGD